jgi:hypothetical protein
MLGALGTKLLLVEDYETLLRVRKGFKKRVKTGAAVSMLERMRASAEQHIVTRAFLRRIGGRGADMRNHKLSARKRSALARRAARVRWRKSRLVELTGTASSPSAP